jgi:hypothetical protein
MDIDDFFINDYWYLFYLWLLNFLGVILLMDIDSFFINGY